MAFVDVQGNRLILKALMTGPPATGKTTRLEQVGEDEYGLYTTIGSSISGHVNVARLHLDAEGSVRPVTIEVYEWHGPEKADARGQGLFRGLDGLIYVADAREDRWVDTENLFKYLMKEGGKSRIQRVPAMLVRGQRDAGLLQMSMIEQKLEGPTWSQKVDADLEDREAFIEQLRLFGEVMLARVL